jgi:hypothetical protein
MCGDYESVEFETRGWRTARKPHECFACHETIRPGDRYHRWSMRFDGEFSDHSHCARCYSIIGELWNAGAESVDLGLNCGETWEENFGDLPEDVARLAFMTPEEGQALMGAAK